MSGSAWRPAEMPTASRSASAIPPIHALARESFDAPGVASSALIFVAPKFRQHAVVLERARVADGLRAGGDVAQQAPHDLARARLRQRLGETDLRRPRDG